MQERECKRGGVREGVCEREKIFEERERCVREREDGERKGRG